MDVEAVRDIGYGLGPGPKTHDPFSSTSVVVYAISGECILKTQRLSCRSTRDVFVAGIRHPDGSPLSSCCSRPFPSESIPVMVGAEFDRQHWWRLLGRLHLKFDLRSTSWGVTLPR